MTGAGYSIRRNECVRWGVFLLLCLGWSVLGAGSVTAWQDRDAQPAEYELRRVFVPSSRLGQWMKGRQQYLPMSLERYTEILRFLNRKEEQVTGSPVLHTLKMQRNGVLRGTALFRVPRSDISMGGLRSVEFESWKLPGSFSIGNWLPTEPMSEYELNQMELVRQDLAVGVDQDGLFGTMLSEDQHWIYVDFTVAMSTSDLFEGRRQIHLPVLPDTETLVELPAGMSIKTGSENLVQRIQQVPMPGEENVQFYRIAAAGDSLELAFSSQRTEAAKVASSGIRYRVMDRYTLDSNRHRFETTMTIESFDETFERISVYLPPGLRPTRFVVDGKNHSAQLQLQSDGGAYWHLPVREEVPAEIQLAGDFEFQVGQLDNLPRPMISNGVWQEGTVNFIAREPFQIQDFQVVDCHFEGAQRVSDRSSFSIRYLDTNGQVRISATRQVQPRILSSYARLSFQPNEIQSQQWLDLDLTEARSSSVKFRLAGPWVIGQIGAYPLDDQPQESETLQSLVWYRDDVERDLLSVNLPESLLNRRIRVVFQGQIAAGPGEQKVHEGLQLVSDASMPERLVAVTSVSPISTSVELARGVAAIEVDKARQAYPTLSDLIQPEPTYRIPDGQSLAVEVSSTETSAISVAGRINNTLLSKQLLRQDVRFDVQLFGASLQQFRVFTNRWGEELGAWKLEDSEGNEVPFTLQVTATDQGSLTTFKLRQSVSTSLRLSQTRHLTIMAAQTLALYHFPDAGNYAVEVYDRSICDYRLDYLGTPDVGTRSIDTPSLTSSMRDEGYYPSYLYNQSSRFPEFRLTHLITADEAVFLEETYRLDANPEQVRVVCQLEGQLSPSAAINLGLPSGARLDAVVIDGHKRELKQTAGAFQLNGGTGKRQTIEIRYTCPRRLEFLEFSAVNYRLKLPSISLESQVELHLSEDLGLVPRFVPSDVATFLQARWLLLLDGTGDWTFARDRNAWLPLEHGQSFLLYHHRNMVAWRWLSVIIGLLIGVVLFGTTCSLRGKTLAITPMLLVGMALLVTVTPLLIGQLFALGFWGVLIGQATAFVRQWLRVNREETDPTSSAGLTATFSRWALIILFWSVGSAEAFAALQERPVESAQQALVVIPVDEENQPKSVIYLDRKTFDWMSKNEAVMGIQNQVRIQSVDYSFQFDPTKKGFSNFVMNLNFTALNDGDFTLPLPLDSGLAIEEITIDGIPVTAEFADSRIRVPVSDTESGELVVTGRLTGNAVQSELNLTLIPAASVRLEVQSVPSSWMAELLDAERFQLLDRSYSQRRFSLDRIEKAVLRVAADPELIDDPVIETWMNIALNKVNCRTLFNLGPYRSAGNRMVFRADKRLALPARYYFATAGFQIKEVEGDLLSQLYEVQFSNREDLPQWIEVEWETDLASIGQLVAPTIELVEPPVQPRQFLALTVDRRLLYQDSDEGVYERVASNRLPSLQTFEPNQEAGRLLDQVFEYRLEDQSSHWVGDIRLQPVQATGKLTVDYRVGSEMRMNLLGSVAVQQGELPQVRFQVPDSFQLGSVFVGSEQNEVAWTNQVTGPDGTELICFLKRPLNGALDLKLEGRLENTSELKPALLAEQLPDLEYRVNVFNDFENRLSVESKLPRPENATGLMTTEDGFELYAEFQVDGDTPVGDRWLSVQSQSTRTTLQASGFHVVEIDSESREMLRSCFVLEDLQRRANRLELQIPDELGVPRIESFQVPATDAQSTVVAIEDAEWKREEGSRWVLTWNRNVGNAELHLRFSPDAKSKQLRLPQLGDATDQHFLRKGAYLDSTFSVPPANVRRGDGIVKLPQDFSAESEWYELENTSGLVVRLERQNQLDAPITPEIIFQQCGLEPRGAWQSRGRGLFQAVVQTFEANQELQLTIPMSMAVHQVWINGQMRARALEGGDDQSVLYSIPIDPADRLHVVSMRFSIPYEQEVRLPTILGASPSTTFSPVSAEDDTAPNSVSYVDVRERTLEQMKTETVGQLLLDLNRLPEFIAAQGTETQSDRGILLEVASRLEVSSSLAPKESLYLIRPSSKGQYLWSIGIPASLLGLGLVMVVAATLNLGEGPQLVLYLALLVVSSVYGVLLWGRLDQWAAGLGLLSFGMLMLFFFVRRGVDVMQERRRSLN